MIKLLRRCVRLVGQGNLLNLCLLFLGYLGITSGLLQSIPSLPFGLLLVNSASGIAMGWMLARLRFNGWRTWLISASLGLAWLTVYEARLLHPIWELALRLNAFHQGLLQAYRDGIPNPSILSPPLVEIASRTGALFYRLAIWMESIAVGEPVFDLITTRFAWNFLLWAAANWSAWWIFKHGLPLPAMLPAGIALAAVLQFVGESFVSLAPVLASTLLLMVSVGHNFREQDWEAGRIDYSIDIRFDLAWVSMLLVMGIMAAASLSPSISISAIIDLARRLSPARSDQVEEMGRSLGLQPRPAVDEFPLRLQNPGLPRDHLLGSGPELSQKLVMAVRTGERPPGPREMLADQPPSRFYWLGFTYDRYTGRGWLTTQAETVNYLAGEPAAPALPGLYRTVRQEVRMNEDLGGVLFAAGSLQNVDADYRVAWRLRPGPSSPEEIDDAGDVFAASLKSKDYQALSQLSAAGEAELRQAGRNYPAWVRDRYLELPEDLPARVIRLAQELTANQATPYDQAKAIETFLRSFPYSLDLPAPPDNRDVADWFLFDLRQGYCDYYATAMAVLARAAGLPARLAVGYATGIYDYSTASYRVAEADAHSWPQIYFPGIGWIDFEPTSGLPPLDHQGVVSQAGASPPVGFPTAGRVPVSQARSVLLLLAALSTTILAGILLWLSIDGRRLRNLPPQALLSELYHRLRYQARRFSIPLRHSDTPNEFAAKFRERMQDLARIPRLSTRIPPITREASTLTEMYTISAYSPHPPGSNERHLAILLWSRLSRRLWLLLLYARLSRQ